MNEKYIYILMSDGDGTMHSVPTPFGVAVDSKEEADRFVREAEEKGWWDPCYGQIKIFSNKDDAIKWAFKK